MINYFKNKKILITGSSSGIGFGLAKRFSELECKVIMNGRNLNKECHILLPTFIKDEEKNKYSKIVEVLRYLILDIKPS